MDDVLPKLLHFPPHPLPQISFSDTHYDEGIRHHIHVVSALPEKSLLQQMAGQESVLDVVDPSRNTSSYIFVLIAYINAFNRGNKNVHAQVLYAKINKFLGTFDGRQIRYLGKEFNKVVDSLVQIVVNDRRYELGVAPVRNAILGLDPSGTVLTTRHIQLVQLALDSMELEDALPVLEKFVLYFSGNPKNQKPKYLSDMKLSPSSYVIPELNQTARLKSSEVLSYFLWTGMIYIGLRRWDRALDCLESAITYPIKDGSVSRIMVEAYKKWVLVGLLLEGKILSLPNSVSSQASKAFHIIGKPYETLAQIFETGTAARLKSEADYGERVWGDDFNIGLVVNVLAAYQKFQICNLGNVYSKISIPEIHSQTMSAESGKHLTSAHAVESLVQEMISDDLLRATLSYPSTGPAVLTFSPSGPSLPENQVQQKLAEATERIQALTQEVKQTDRMLTHDKEYIKYAQKLKKNAKIGVLGDQGIAGTDMDWNGEEEELMTGVDDRS